MPLKHSSRIGGYGNRIPDSDHHDISFESSLTRHGLKLLLLDVDWSTGPDNNPYSMVL